MFLNLTGYDFMDFGSGPGDTIAIMKGRYGGGRCLGIDREVGLQKVAKEKGFDFIASNLLGLEFVEDMVRFTSIGHLIEHLGGFEEMEKVLSKALGASKEFVFVNGPCWDCTSIVHKHGLKFYWEGFTDHTYRVEVQDMKEVLDKLDAKYILMASHFVKDTAHTDLIPIDSECYHSYKQKEHGIKITEIFKTEIYITMTGFLWKGRIPNLHFLLRDFRENVNHRVLFERLL